MGTIAELLGRDISTLTRQLAGLVKAGLVARKACPQDGRAVLVTVTGKGRRMLKRAAPVLLDVRDRTMNSISKNETTELVRLLSTMLANLK